MLLRPSPSPARAGDDTSTRATTRTPTRRCRLSMAARKCMIEAVVGAASGLDDASSPRKATLPHGKPLGCVDCGRPALHEVEPEPTPRRPCARETAVESLAALAP